MKMHLFLLGWPHTLRVPFVASLLLMSVIASAPDSGAEVVINEFMASNDSTLVDGDGKYSDWIELHNNGGSAVDLTGWYLTDDETDLTQWVFPATSIPAGGYLVVFASGQDAAGYTDAAGYLHTHFKLSKDGESIVLVRADGTTIEHSTTNYPEQSADVAYGLAQGSSFTELVYLTTPTPGAANTGGITGYVGDTTFSVHRGFFTAAFDLEITCATAGAAIYYTTDGTEPATNNGTLYTGPVSISKTTVLRAAAFVSGYEPSNVDTQTYIFLTDIIAQGTSVSGLDPAFPSSAVNGQDFDYGMDTAITQSATYSGEMETALKSIPSISLVTDPDNLFNSSTGIYVNASQEGEAWEREMSLELINPDGSKGFQINGGMRIRGESSTTSSNPKHSFRFLFKSEYGASKLEYPLFGEGGADSFKRLDLRTGQNFSWANQNPDEATWLYDIFSRDTHRDMNQPHTRGEYYHLYINGMYWGLYQTEERCDSRYAASYYGGDNDDYDAVKADGDTGDMYAVDGTRDAYEDLWTGMTAGVTGNASYFSLQGKNADGTENSSGTKLLDVDNVIDYMLLTYFTANRDSPIGPPNSATMPRNLTTVYSRSHPDGFKFVAHDNEHSLEISEGVNHNRFNQSLSTSFNGINRMTPWWMHLKLMGNTEYKLRYADRVHQHFFNNGALTATQTAARMQVRKDEIFSAVVAESARWGDSASSGGPGGGPPGGGPPGGGTTTTTRTRNVEWLDAVDWLLDTYMPQRSSIVLNQIIAKGWYPTVAAPEFSQHGGSVVNGYNLTISGSGTIYYTTDGSDPRAVGGTAVGTAYGSAVTLTKSTLVKARVLSGGTWSALTEATFELVDASPLRVTEIMYNPAAGTSGDELNHDDQDFEFIELQNTGTEIIGLAGLSFCGGIYFNFSEGNVLTLGPGEYVVLVNNLAAFTARYPGAAGMNIAGEYRGKFYDPDGSLDNGGEGIVLQDSLGRIILDFEYDDWFEQTDGAGYSLTLIDPYDSTSTLSDSTSWRSSADVGGTPGAVATDPDSDSDGMPDSWEKYHFGGTGETDDGDWDKDGTANIMEYLAGTDPDDPESVFHITSIAQEPAAVVLHWSSVEGKTYTVQRSGDLTDGSWVDVETGIPATAPTNTYTHAISGTAAFYRVVVE
ncbi:MAG: lamin tail domain-containing protein [Akkermansiaceae bacterium]|nr:lamin tail domain-containing protein [Akkermansiaceae bacterium]